MAQNTDNIIVDNFLPPTNINIGKKRAGTTDFEEMQVDEISGVEGNVNKGLPKTKKRKFTNLEIRKISVPRHRLI